MYFKYAPFGINLWDCSIHYTIFFSNSAMFCLAQPVNASKSTHTAAVSPSAWSKVE